MDYINSRGVRHHQIKVNKTKKDVGKSLTIENDTLEISDLAKMSQLGLDLPARAEIQVDAIEQITDDAYDIMDVEKYALMDRVDRAIERNRLASVKDAMLGAYEKRLSEFKQVEYEKRKELHEKTPDDSTPDSSESA